MDQLIDKLYFEFGWLVESIVERITQTLKLCYFELVE